MRSPSENRRAVLKQMLSGRLTKEEAFRQLEKEKPFDAYAALVEFMGSADNHVVRAFFPNHERH